MDKKEYKKNLENLLKNDTYEEFKLTQQKRLLN
jgi:hypothetical protein